MFRSLFIAVGLFKNRFKPESAVTEFIESTMDKKTCEKVVEMIENQQSEDLKIIILFDALIKITLNEIMNLEIRISKKNPKSFLRKLRMLRLLGNRRHKMLRHPPRISKIVT